MGFLDYKEPIEYVVDNYFKRQRFLTMNRRGAEGVALGHSAAPDFILPDVPAFLIRNSDDKVKKIIYGDVTLLTADEDSDPVIWQEELVRDSSGKVFQLITTYPDGESVTIELFRDSTGKVAEYGFA